MKRWHLVVIFFLSFPTILYFIQTCAYYELNPKAIGFFLSDIRFYVVISLAIGSIMLFLPFSFSRKLALIVFSAVYSTSIMHLSINKAHELDKIFLGQAQFTRLQEAKKTNNLTFLKNASYTTDRYGDYAYYLNYSRKKILDMADEDASLLAFNKKFEKLKFLSDSKIAKKEALQSCQKKLQSCKEALLELYRKTYNRCENAYLILQQELPTNACIFEEVLDNAAQQTQADLDYYTQCYDVRYGKIEAAEKIVDFLLKFFELYRVENQTVLFSSDSLNDEYTSLVTSYLSYDEKLKEVIDQLAAD